jgi:hypothetical protein
MSLMNFQNSLVLISGNFHHFFGQKGDFFWVDVLYSIQFVNNHPGSSNSNVIAVVEIKVVFVF